MQIKSPVNVANIKAGVEYEVTRKVPYDADLVYIKDDAGNEILCRLSWCAHIKGNAWEVVK